MELYIVRHGQTRWNVENRLQGLVDIPLNPIGIEAAKALGEELKDVSFDCIYASPLYRAQTTAKCIKGTRNIPLISDNRLVEMIFGKDEGMLYEFWNAEGSQYHVFVTEPEKYIAPEGAESLEELCERAKSFIQEKIEPNYKEYNRVMVVAHGCLNKAIVSYLEKRTPEDFWKGDILKNTEAIIYEYDGQNWSHK